MFATPSPASTESAYRVALREAKEKGQTRLDVRNLLIGCTTNEKAQAELSTQQFPFSEHDHRSNEWVSLDVNPKISPDIVGSAVDIKSIIGLIKQKVYIEHFNDGQGATNTLGDIMKRAYDILGSSAFMYVDIYIQIMFLNNSLHFDYLDSTNIREISRDAKTFLGVEVANGENNPFWLILNWKTFAEKMRTPKVDAEWDLRNSVMQSILDLSSYELMPGIKEYDGKTTNEKADAFLSWATKMGNEKAGTATLRGSLSHYFATKKKEEIVKYVKQLGFEDVRAIQFDKVANPFNGRRGEWMIVARKKRSTD